MTFICISDGCKVVIEGTFFIVRGVLKTSKHVSNFIIKAETEDEAIIALEDYLGLYAKQYNFSQPVEFADLTN